MYVIQLLLLNPKIIIIFVVMFNMIEAIFATWDKFCVDVPR